MCVRAGVRVREAVWKLRAVEKLSRRRRARGNCEQGATASPSAAATAAHLGATASPVRWRIPPSLMKRRRLVKDGRAVHSLEAVPRALKPGSAFGGSRGTVSGGGRA